MTEEFDIKIEVKTVGLEILIRTKDPLDPSDCITITGMIISHLRKNGKEPSVVILP